MGRQKLLMPFGGEPILDRVLRTVTACGFEKTIAVVSRETEGLLSPVRGVIYLINPDPDRGQDSSFRRGLKALDDGSSFALFLGDKPLITASQIQDLKRRFLDSPKSALVPQRDGVPGHPGFYEPLWRERFLRPGAARATLFRYADDVQWTPGHESCFFDVDTPEDYRRLESNVQTYFGRTDS
jgi:molybdenum cofactor cytidylyltransferase